MSSRTTAMLFFRRVSLLQICLAVSHAPPGMPSATRCASIHHRSFACWRRADSGGKLENDRRRRESGVPVSRPCSVGRSEEPCDIVQSSEESSIAANRQNRREYPNCEGTTSHSYRGDDSAVGEQGRDHGIEIFATIP